VEVIITQDRLFHEFTWTITSFDILLGLIGGFVGLIWAVLIYLLGGYENFRYEQEIISEIYSTTPREGMDPD